MKKNKNFRILSQKSLISPKKLKKIFPLNKCLKNQVKNSRKIISNIIKKKDKRLLLVCGPCSIHDIESTLDYAYRLKSIAKILEDKLYIIMRVYFEKPRTTTGWKGLINDPYMDNSFNMGSGLYIARKLLINLLSLNIPLATEVLDLNNPQYIGDLFSWAAIGARTTESQIHREIASGLSMPVGFKNGTDGNLETAINAICASKIPHRFVGINQLGKVCILQTKGNKDVHIILRGGKLPNYYNNEIIKCEKQMLKSNLIPSLVIDCSHGNSNKDFNLQPEVAKNIIKQIKYKNNSIIGLMLESNINEGQQILTKDINKIKYGISVTDACLNWKTTENLLCNIYKSLIN
ncbi:Phospho-2-dehydro-3-deoxyheptonate aldolase, Tyr-sensitive [Candidatus Annandia adelgestsuga]|uniref:Phospho-2-dehydro-3-deoxyheptonate aldolase n=1 Tax=Candidatus Annandia adelgestsuga TaxID=1302411 RepID=A0A3Q9CLQ5_9ENTR|nr:3-deoxy-7-phosphoheptulonate synthase [Candidatus Annandia adelgestsuga]AZP36153.1 Phospho-2-dehydro-3-deoxyheptonate aldolase, Tyr-sensitive [Candidatus Annandia adelgestsuga]